MTKKVDVPNTHRCIKGLWDKLTPFQQRLYNNFQEFSQDMVVHPKTKLPDEQWKTITHNMGLLAAWEALILLNEMPLSKVNKR